MLVRLLESRLATDSLIAMDCDGFGSLGERAGYVAEAASLFGLIMQRTELCSQ